MHLKKARFLVFSVWMRTLCIFSQILDLAIPHSHQKKRKLQTPVAVLGMKRIAQNFLRAASRGDHAIPASLKPMLKHTQDLPHSQLRNVANWDFWHATNELFTVPRMHPNSATESQLLASGNSQTKKRHGMLEIGMGGSQWLMR